MKLLIVGATGLVGSHVLSLALADSRVTQVIAPTRRDLPEHAKLWAPTVDFNHLPDEADLWGVDAVVCTLGFSSLTIVRPNVISGHRSQERLGEVVVIRVISFLSRLLPASCQISPATNIASALLEGAVNPIQGVNIVSSKQLA
ncbi:hypothetical protein HBA43_14805 [Providencia rettgeri]|uniref:hypothetical protein n=1 Tax=Providencia rettgeri TaxID=587 RepID=UPI0014199720|nr:hypothetical protein [Providencia rettgeri]NIA75826.1 hypothetical protein [Providencia rettgeri]NIA79663.1 hypothetical protein [Providencia rettgeri]NIB02883.1 hypothetical protein [Providencia rettgeri]NIB06300.1 hypothetical protein [Providencia rettgeri]NIB20466.1 hypothetical protein [Providencia rettgeri]